MGAAFQELWSRQELRPNCNISIRELWGDHELLPNALVAKNAVRGWSATSGRLRHTQIETEYGKCISNAPEQAKIATELPDVNSEALGRPRTAPEFA